MSSDPALVMAGAGAAPKLPAVAADIPSSFRGPALAALAVTAVTVGLFLLWGAYAPINSGAVAPGEIIPAGKTKTVQHLDGGIIRAIAVKDGDRVAAGALLMQLDEAEARAQLAIAATEEGAQGALLARLQAERDGVNLPPALITGDGSVRNQARLFEARRAALAREIQGLERRIRDARAELAGWEAKGTHLDTLSQHAVEESRINQDLYDRNFIAKPRLLQLESRKAETAASMAENIAEAARARQKITEAESAIAKLRNDWLAGVLEELRRAQEAHTAALERANVARERLSRTRIVAPQEGTVQGLRFTTVGGVIPPGGQILEVTPTSDRLVVEAQLAPDFIDVVRPGLPARVRLTAYKVRRHFTLQGTVTQVSPDTFKEERTGRSYYKLRVEVPDSELQAAGGMTLAPGMLAQVEIVTGERSALRYLLDPLIDSAHRAMKEK